MNGSVNSWLLMARKQKMYTFYRRKNAGEHTMKVDAFGVPAWLPISQSCHGMSQYPHQHVKVRNGH